MYVCAQVVPFALSKTARRRQCARCVRAQVVAISKPLKLTYSWGKPAKQTSSLPPPSALIERSGSAVADMMAAARPLSASQEAAAAAAAAAFPPIARLQPAMAAAPGAAWADINGTGMVRRLLQRGDLGEAGRFKGQQVEVYWPQDGTWWLARVIKVHSVLSLPPSTMLPTWMACT